MKKVFAVLLSVLCVISLVGCHKDVDNSKLSVVVSILPFQEFVEQIAGDYVDVYTMIPQCSDPHTFDPAPSQMVGLSNADMYVKVGAGLEFEITYMDKIESLNSEMLIVDASKNIDLLENNDEDLSSATNPHIWLSPINAIVICQNIADGLCQLDDKHTSEYRTNLQKYIEQLELLDSSIRYNLQDITNRNFMVLHPQWEYFAKEYDLNQIAIEVDGKEPGAQTLALLIDTAKENNIKVVFTSPQFSTASAEAIRSSIDGKVVSVDSLAKNYIDNMYTVLAVFIGAMS